MLIRAYTILFKTKNFWRSGPSFLMGVLHLEAIQFVVIAELEIFPFREGKLLVELHANKPDCSSVYESELKVVSQRNPDEPNLAGKIMIGDKWFHCTALVTREALVAKSLTLEFLEIGDDEQPLQSAPSLNHRIVRPNRSRPALR
ncbi:hypothetical protein CSC82_04855 [Rhodobacteraceae bacterium 4F10]|nr:hypothetical protein CSC82_04855 [Rhodobacteraceae bacterium 4F10]